MEKWGKYAGGGISWRCKSRKCTCLTCAFQKEFGSMREKEPGRRADGNSLVEPVVVLSAAWISKTDLTRRVFQA